MPYKYNCLLCNAEIVYSQHAEQKNCSYCNKSFATSTLCKNGHFICDHCHSKDANDIILETCLNSLSVNPFELAIQLMKHPSVKMHGSEHHFLVPAVLITSYLNLTGQSHGKQDMLTKASQRSKQILGGFCGFYGSCGAGIGVGIALSILTNTTPLSTNSRGASNGATADALMKISKYGGPRCCKRDTLSALESAVESMNSYLGCNLKVDDSISCVFYKLNKHCIKSECKYYNY